MQVVTLYHQLRDTSGDRSSCCEVRQIEGCRMVPARVDTYVPSLITMI